MKTKMIAAALILVSAVTTQWASAQQADAQAQDAAANAARIEQEQTEEALCLAKDKIAYDKIMLAAARKGIAAENANPAGVRNLVHLYELGLEVQTLTTQLRTLEPAFKKLEAHYTKFYHKKMNYTGCAMPLSGG